MPGASQCAGLFVMPADFEIRIPDTAKIDHTTLYELECFGRFSPAKLSRVRLLLHHGFEVQNVLGLALDTGAQEPPATFRGIPVEYVLGPFSTFEYTRAQ